MQLPERIREFVERRVAGVSASALERAAAALSDHYRGGEATATAPLAPQEKLAAYLATRLPATFAAASAVLAEVRRRLRGIRVSSILDLGAGTGAATLAAREIFPDLADCTLVEADAELAAAGRELTPDARWVEGDLRQAAMPAHDLVVASYVFGEISSPMSAIERAWQAARIALVVIEPGTTRGFTLVRQVRDRLLKQGAGMVAPCPGGGACPMIAPDWCHFGQRVERSSLHRRMKKGALGYEDEKFSYVALARAFAGRAPGRVVRRPALHPGWVELTVCRNEGIRTERVSRKQGAAYRAARKAAWGDSWPPEYNRGLRRTQPQASDSVSGSGSTARRRERRPWRRSARRQAPRDGWHCAGSGTLPPDARFRDRSAHKSGSRRGRQGWRAPSGGRHAGFPPRSRANTAGRHPKRRGLPTASRRLRPGPARLRSGHRNRSGWSSPGEPLQTPSLPQPADVRFSVSGVRPVVPEAHQRPHCFLAPGARIHVSPAHGLANELGNGESRLARAHVQGGPDVVFNVQLGALHDV